jgi:hypothetical protein
MDANCKGCNMQAAPASPPPQMVMTIATPHSPPLSPTGSTVELLEHEESKGDWKGTDNCCCCCEKGGNKLTLTDKRVIIKYWENCMPGCVLCPQSTSRVRTRCVCACVCVRASAACLNALCLLASFATHIASRRPVVPGVWATQLLRVEHAGRVI